MKIKTVILLFMLFALVTALVTALFGYLKPPAGETDRYITTLIKQGDIVVNFSATGTIEPEEVIDVGAQVTGQIVTFGKDQDGRTIDYGSVVKKGMILAQIDDALFAAQVTKEEAELQYAKANLTRVKADYQMKKVKYDQADSNWLRAQQLQKRGVISRLDYENYQSAFEVAREDVSVSKAKISQAQAGIARAEATLRRVKLNLTYCTIKAPVNGIIIDKRADIGQTVVSDLNAPSLFLLAKDLKNLQIWVSVNEADVLKIYEGQPVSFTVDALPQNTFKGIVGKLRLNAAMTQNVVTYIVEVNIDNSDKRLLPYLTANVEFEVNKKTDVLMVLNSAFQWKPVFDHIAPEFRAKQENPEQQKKYEATLEILSAKGNTETNQSIIWAKKDKYVYPLYVYKGLTDGIMTQVHGEGLKEGLEIVIKTEAVDKKPGKGEGKSGNPFMVNLPPGPGSQGKNQRP
jgi:HlyD family secretion protein